MPTERRPSLAGPSSAFPSASVCCHCDRLTLTDLHPVHAIPAGPLAPTPSPPSVPYAGIFASSPGGQTGFGVPPFHHRRSACPVGAGSTPSGRRDNVSGRGTSPPTTLPFGVRCLNQFHLFFFPTFYPRFLASPSVTGLVGHPLLVGRRRTFVRKLQTPRLAKPLRRLRSPYAVVQA